MRRITMAMLALLGAACVRRGETGSTAAMTEPAPVQVTVGPEPALAPRVEATPVTGTGAATRLRLAEPAWVVIVADYGGAFGLLHPRGPGNDGRWTAGVHQKVFSPALRRPDLNVCTPARERPTDPVRSRSDPCRVTTVGAARAPRQVLYLSMRAELSYDEVYRGLLDIEPAADLDVTLALLANRFEEVAAGRVWGGTVVRNPRWLPGDYDTLVR